MADENNNNNKKDLLRAKHGPVLLTRVPDKLHVSWLFC